MDDIKRIHRKYIKDAKKRLPGLSDAAADRLVMLRIGLVFQHPDASDAQLDTHFNNAIQQAVTNGEDWAAEATTIVTDTVFRPAYEKALVAGVDPVPVLQANGGLDEEQARKVVTALANEAAPAPHSSNGNEDNSEAQAHEPA